MTPLELLILRHAKSSWRDRELPDHQRPLNTRGERDAPRMGRLIRERSLFPGRILSSDAVRARETALRVREAAGSFAPLELLRELYLAAPETYIAQLSRVNGSTRRVMVVGHNPGLEELTRLLTGRDETLPTGCLVHVRLVGDTWYKLPESARGELLGVWRPKELGDDN